MARKDSKRSIWSWLFPVALGAGLAYFLDPDRRNTARDTFGSMVNKGTQQAGSVTNYAGGQAFGAAREAVSHAGYGVDNPDPDDNTLRDRVESEVFRDPEYPKGNLNINVVGGIVEVRGELDSQRAIDDLVKRVKSIPHVRGVHNYLHLPGTPAPNKADALEAS